MSLLSRRTEPDEPSISEWLATGEHDDLSARSLPSLPAGIGVDVAELEARSLPAVPAGMWAEPVLADVPDHPLDLVTEGQWEPSTPLTDWDDWAWQYDLNGPPAPPA